VQTPESKIEAGPQDAWHELEGAALTGPLQTSITEGLSETEAKARLSNVGPNELTEFRARNPLVIFLDQFRDFMIGVLLVAGFVSGLVGEPQDAIAILVIVVLNALIGGIQTWRSERAVAVLRGMSAPNSLVVRDGTEASLPARALVPGDVVILATGDRVPADVRLVEVAELRVDESLLTGESVPVDKSSDALHDPELPVADQVNMAFRGSLVTHGRARGLVVATGLRSQIGAIASSLSTQQQTLTPLQLRLASFGRRLALAVLAICALIFVSGLLRGEQLMLMFLTAVSLAVAAIPEALPAVVTISLAFGARRMSQHNALIRHLPAVETLGSVTTICSDKTGTLTQNRMRAERFVLGDEETEAAQGPAAGTHWQRMCEALALSNDVGRDESGALLGDPTEVALYQAVLDAGVDVSGWREASPRLAEVAFESTRQRMSTIHRVDDEIRLYCKGSPEQLLPRCRDRLSSSGDTRELDASAPLEQAEALALQGFRVLAFACRTLDAVPKETDADALERDLHLIGLVGLIDPPRPEAAWAVAECKSAGIVPVMITGDHAGTARAIARRLGIGEDGGEVLTGEDLEALSQAELRHRIRDVQVFARVSPAQKISIIEALQSGGEFVAMTGDGVNDAPALKRADIGVAMGQKGTDVAREAADMVLLDDDFATIVRAVHEGRRIFDNVRKFIKDAMSSNSGEIWTLVLAPFLGLPIPLLPIHILWINLLTDGLPGLAFTAEPAEPHVMKRGPRPPQESIFAHGMWEHIVWVGLFVAAVSLTSQAWAIGRGVEHWQTVIFTVLTVSQLFHSMAVRSERESLFSIGLTSNLPMLGAVILTFFMQLAVIYLPPLQSIFHTQALPLGDLLVCLAASSLVLWAVEIEKWVGRRRSEVIEDR